MIFIIFLVGALVLLTGLLPLLKEYGVLSITLPQGQLYYVIIAVLGLIILWYSLKKSGNPV